VRRGLEEAREIPGLSKAPVKAGKHPGDHAFFELFRILGAHNFRRSPLPPNLTQNLSARGDIYPDTGFGDFQPLCHPEKISTGILAL
jgi:hypothetical protein